jgi:hypothetical protein
MILILKNDYKNVIFKKIFFSIQEFPLELFCCCCCFFACLLVFLIIIIHNKYILYIYYYKYYFIFVNFFFNTEYRIYIFRQYIMNYNNRSNDITSSSFFYNYNNICYLLLLLSTRIHYKILSLANSQ